MTQLRDDVADARVRTNRTGRGDAVDGSGLVADVLGANFVMLAEQFGGDCVVVKYRRVVPGGPAVVAGADERPARGGGNRKVGSSMTASMQIFNQSTRQSAVFKSEN